MTIWPRLATIVIILATMGSSSLVDASDTDDACVDVATDQADQRSGEYAELIVNAFSEDLEPPERFQPSNVEIYNILESGDWSAVNAAIPTADMAMFFFEQVEGKKRFKDVWGGMAEPEERPGLIEWAANLGAPQNLATCFPDQVTGGAG